MRTVTLHTQPCTFFIIPRSVLSRMRNLSGKIWRKKIKIHILCSTNFWFFENCTFYEIMWKNTAEPGRPKMIWRTRIACWIPAATNTHSECVILIAFPQREWLQEFASLLRCTYSTWPVLLQAGTRWYIYPVI
jgi:hypothetical protein